MENVKTNSTRHTSISTERFLYTNRHSFVSETTHIRKLLLVFVLRHLDVILKVQKNIEFNMQIQVIYGRVIYGSMGIEG